MAATATVTRRIRRSFDTVGAFLTDPHRVLSVVSTLGRCEFVGPAEDGAGGELWDVFLEVGTIQLGGRVRVVVDPGVGLHWESQRGTRHRFSARAQPDGHDTLLSMRLTLWTTGFGIGWLTELVGRGIMSRNLYAASEELRHHLEFEI